MQCDRIEEWLNAGLPPEGEEAAHLHAAECPACARAIATGRAMERALAAAPIRPRSDQDAFVTSVLARIDRESTPVPAREGRTKGKLWWDILAEPAFLLGSVALSLLALVPAITRQDAGHSLAITTTVAFEALGSALESLASAGAGAFSGVATLDPVARATVLACFLALLAWAGMWATTAVDRWLRPGTGRRV